MSWNGSEDDRESWNFTVNSWAEEHGAHVLIDSLHLAAGM